MKKEMKTYKCKVCGTGTCVLSTSGAPRYCSYSQSFTPVWTEVKKCAQCGEYVNVKHTADICNDCWLKYHHSDSDGDVPGVDSPKVVGTKWVRGVDRGYEVSVPVMMTEKQDSVTVINSEEFAEKYRDKEAESRTDYCVECGEEYEGEDIRCPDCLKKVKQLQCGPVPWFEELAGEVDRKRDTIPTPCPEVDRFDELVDWSKAAVKSARDFFKEVWK